MSTAVTQPVEPEVDKETGKFIFTYQPRDADGQFIGKPYKYLYTDHADLAKQLAEGKEHGDRFIHEVKTGKRKLVGEPEIPKPSFQPEAAKPEEQKPRDDWRKAAEQELGAPLDAVRDTLKRANQFDEYLIANTWALANEANGYFMCPQNAKTMDKYLKDNKLRLSAANLDLAFEALKDTLVSKPQEQPPADSTQQQPPTKAAETKPQSTGIIPGQFAGTRTPNRTEKQPLTRERFRQIDKMSRDQFNQLKRTNRAEYDAFVLMKTPAQPQQ